jgi:hypothetical protein
MNNTKWHFHILLPNQHQTLCAVLILGDIFLCKDDSLKESSPSVNINTHAILQSTILANLVSMQDVAKALASTAM